MFLRITLHPQIVSFGNLKAKELPGPASNLTGDFLVMQELYDLLKGDSGFDFINERAHTGDAINPDWSAINQDNTWPDDVVMCDGSLSPGQAFVGSLTWDIPVRWTINVFEPPHELPNRTQINQILDAQGTPRVTKFGLSEP
jgi:hypothetical protein